MTIEPQRIEGPEELLDDLIDELAALREGRTTWREFVKYMDENFGGWRDPHVL